jgi:uroporphyrinogen-III synthase
MAEGEIQSQLQTLQLDKSSIPVYLLKTKSLPADGYEEQLNNDGKYQSIFVPVLEHRFHDDALRTLRRAAERFAFAGSSPATARQPATHNPARRYGGIIFTSQRAVDAFASVVAKLDPTKVSNGALFAVDMPIYVVGPATARGVRALGLPCPVIGEEAGSGDVLAAKILEHYNVLPRDATHQHERPQALPGNAGGAGSEGNGTGDKLPLLFLTGEQRRDIIPKTLQSADLFPFERIGVVEVVVYETGEMAEFEEVFGDLLREAKKARVTEQAVVVFSPQGCEAMLSALDWIDEQTGRYSASRREIVSGPTKTRIITIGPTTRDFLVEQFGFEPDFCSETPSPIGVKAALESTRSS